MSAQRRLRSAWASTQSHQSLRCPHGDTLIPYLPTERTVKTDLTWRNPRLSWVFAGRIGQFCWFSRDEAQIIIMNTLVISCLFDHSTALLTDLTVFNFWLIICFLSIKSETGPARSVGYAVWLIFRKSRVRSSAPAPYFVEIWSWNNLYGHSLPTADSSRAGVSMGAQYWLTA